MVTTQQARPVGEAAAVTARPWRSYAGLVLGVALIVGAVWVVEGGRSAEGEGASTAVSLSGARGAAPKVGEAAPDFALERPDGTALALADLRGKAVVMNFWTTWCPPCRGEMPDLDALAREYREAGLVVLAVNLQEDATVVRRYASTLGLSALEIVLDKDGLVASRYNLSSLPTTYFIDREGKVRELNVGALTAKSLKARAARVL